MNPKILAFSCAIMAFLLCMIALLKGIDGVALGIGLTVIGGLGGYGISKFGGNIINFFNKFKIEKR